MLPPHSLRLLHLLLFASVLAACSGGPLTSSSSTGGDGGTSDPSPTDPPAEGDGGVTDPKAAAKKPCEELIACAAELEPASAGALVTLYGDASNCWKGCDP